MLLGELADNVACELGDVLAAAPQRRHADDALRNDFIKCLREQAALRQALEVAVAGRDNAHVNRALDILLAEAVRLACLQSGCELISNRLRHLLDLVEEQRAARSKLEASLMADLRALHDAENLLLEKLRRRIAAAQRNQRPGRAVARLMDAMRHALLARAGLALDQDMMLVARHAGRLFTHARERRTAADHRAQAVLRRVARRMRHERPQILDRH